MCLIETLGLEIWNKEFLEYYTLSIWLLNFIVLCYWMLELLLLRKVLRCRIHSSQKCKLKIATSFSIILLSILASFISSTFFLSSSFSPSNITCTYGPKAAISLRFLSKHFIWGFYIVRGQMVMETIDNTLLHKFAKKSPYIISSQIFIIIAFILIFTSSYYDPTVNECRSDIPLWLIISVAFIGEILYGICFIYIFYKAINNSMHLIGDSLRQKEHQKTQNQLTHHLIVYFIQFLLSSLYIINIASCGDNTYAAFDIFQTELLISNICVLTLFRGRQKLFRKRFCRKITKREKELENYINHPPKNKPVLTMTESNNSSNPMIITAQNAKTLNIVRINENNEGGTMTMTNHDEDKDISTTSSNTTPPIPSVRSKSTRNSNYFLPDEWLSPRSIKKFKRRWNTDNKHGLKSFHKQASSSLHIITQSEPIPLSASRINRKHGKDIKSHSTTMLDVRKQSDFKIIVDEKEKEIEIIHIPKPKENKHKSTNLLLSPPLSPNKASFAFSSASSLLKKATKLFNGINSHSSPINHNNDRNEDFASVSPFPVITSHEDNYNYITRLFKNNKGDNSPLSYSDNHLPTSPFSISSRNREQATKKQENNNKNNNLSDIELGMKLEIVYNDDADEQQTVANE